MDQKELAAQCGIGYDKLRGILSWNDKREVDLDDLYAIADACDVPRRFVESGWVRDPTDARLAQLESAVREQGEQIAGLQALAARRVLSEAGATGAPDAAPAAGRRPGRLGSSEAGRNR
jgi:transcriptional regulator with XRE-family HTH domain